MGKMKWNGKFLCLCLLLAALAISASAAEDTEHFAGGSGAENRYLAVGTTYMSKVRSYLDTHFKLVLNAIEGGDTQQMAELTCDIDLKAENTNLWAENNRKAKMIDMFIESQQGKKG